MPEIEVAVDEPMVRALLGRLPERLAHLRVAPVRPGGMGWDNAVWRVGEQYALRLPLSAPAAGALANEARWAEAVSEPLRTRGIRVTRPVHQGVSPHYPWPWLLVTWVPGTPVSEISPGERAAIADRLADSLPGLHRPAPPDAPVNPGRGRPLSARQAMTLRAAERARPWLGDHAVDALLDIVDIATAAAPWPGPPLWCHGDLHDLNLILDTTADPAHLGIIDFGDLTSGDPAVDLRVLWTTFTAAQRASVLARLTASGAYDGDAWVRAQGWAAAFALAVAGDERGRLTMAATLDHTRTQLGCP